jgi:hypothetical protein
VASNPRSNSHCMLPAKTNDDLHHGPQERVLLALELGRVLGKHLAHERQGLMLLVQRIDLHRPVAVNDPLQRIAGVADELQVLHRFGVRLGVLAAIDGDERQPLRRRRGHAKPAVSETVDRRMLRRELLAHGPLRVDQLLVPPEDRARDFAEMNLARPSDGHDHLGNQRDVFGARPACSCYFLDRPLQPPDSPCHLAPPFVLSTWLELSQVPNHRQMEGGATFRVSFILHRSLDPPPQAETPVPLGDSPAHRPSKGIGVRLPSRALSIAFVDVKPPIGATMKLSPEDIGRIQRSEVRWMGVGVGILLMLVGSALAIGAFLTAGAVLRAGIERSELPTLLFIFAAEMGLGVPMLLYGRSLFRRARTERIVVTGPPRDS